MVMFINRSGSIVLFFMTLYLTRHLHFSIVEAGQMMSIYGAGALVGSYFGGWMSDKWGTKWVQFFSLVFSGAGFIILGFVTKPVAIALILFYVAMSAEALRPANNTAMASVCLPEKRARGFALNRLAINLGISIGPTVGGFLASYHYGLLFWVDGITCLIAALILWFLFRGKQFEKQLIDAESSSTSQGSPWKDRIFLIILGFTFISGIVFFQLFNTWPLFLREEYRLVEQQIGLLMMMNALMVVFLEMPLIRHLETFRKFRVIAVGEILLFGGFGLLALSRGWLYATFTVIIWTFGEMLVFPNLSGFIANRASDLNRGKYMGMFTFTFALAFVTAPALGTAVYSAYGSKMLWLGCGGVGLLIGGGYFILDRKIDR